MGIVLLEGYPTGTSGTVKSNMPVATHSREISYPTLPSSGKYRYASITEITRANHKWEIPAGCVFEGNIVPFTGTVNMEITNADGD